MNTTNTTLTTNQIALPLPLLQLLLPHQNYITISIFVFFIFKYIYSVAGAAGASPVLGSAIASATSSAEGVADSALIVAISDAAAAEPFLAAAFAAISASTSRNNLSNSSCSPFLPAFKPDMLVDSPFSRSLKNSNSVNKFKTKTKLNITKKTKISDLKKIEIEAESGAGLVKIVMNGKYQVKKIQIDDSILNDKQMLSDLVSSAFNSGVSKVEKAIEEKMSSVAGNMNLGNMKFPF